jgi:hypothetical protein
MARVEGQTIVASSVRKKRPARVFLVALLATVLYFILFPYPLGREIVAVPVWAVPVPPAGTVTAPEGSVPAPFRLGDLFGFAARDGGFLHVEKVLFRVALSRRHFINYTRLGTNWILENERGGRVLSFSGYGYPLLSGDGGRIFIVKADLSGLIEVDRNGDPLWSRDFPSLMTSISVQKERLLVGLLSGSMLVLDAKGDPLFESSPGGSRIPGIFGVALSPNGNLLASISGIDPQYLTVLRRERSTYAVLERTTTGTDFRREARIQFSSDSRYLLLEGKNAAGLFDPESRQLSWIDLKGTLAGASFPGQGRYAAFASRDGGAVHLEILSPFMAPLFSETFPAQQLFLGEIDGQLLLGLDGRLLRIDLEAL